MNTKQPGEGLLLDDRRTTDHGSIVAQVSEEDNVAAKAFPVPENPWSQCVSVWLQSMPAEATRKAYQQAMANFLAYCGMNEAYLGLASKQDVIGWISSMRQKKLADGTIQARVAAISSFFSFASTYMVPAPGAPGGGELPLMCRANPANGKTYQRSCTSGKGRALTAEEVQRLLLAVPTHTLNGKRDYAMLLGFVILGRRNTEWRLASMDRFELRGADYYFKWDGKGHEDELVMVPDEVWQALTDYIQASGGRTFDDWIFLSRQGEALSERRVGQMVSRYARLAGIQGRLRVHDLRHTAAMLRRQAGADVEEIRAFLRHKSLATTQIYLHRMESQKDNGRADQVAKLLNLKKDNGHEKRN